MLSGLMYRDVLSMLSPADRKRVRSLMVDLVLATDLSISFDLIGRFKLFLESETTTTVTPTTAAAAATSALPPPRFSMLRSLTVSRPGGAAVVPPKPTPTPNREWCATPAGQLLMMQMVIKVSDIGHAAKPLQQHIVWSNLISNEFFLQVGFGLGCDLLPLLVVVAAAAVVVAVSDDDNDDDGA